MQHHILGYVAEDPINGWGKNINRGGAKRRLASYAVVCSGWRAFFEPRLFRKLTVTQRDFQQLRRLEPRAKQWTKYIWLRIELDPYDCGDCCQPESNYTHGKNTDVTERAMLEFFQIMSWWSYNYYGDGITLEISIHSPSDREHAFRSFDFDAVPNHESPEANLSHPAYDPGHDPSWARKAGAIRRLFGRGAMPVEFGCSLPTAEIISRLVVRRQTRRRMTPTGYARTLNANSYLMLPRPSY